MALVRPEAVGLGLAACLNVRLEKHTESHKRNPMDLFRVSVQVWSEALECASLTGEVDCLLRVVVQDMAHCSRFTMDTLHAQAPQRAGLQNRLFTRPGQGHDCPACVDTGCLEAVNQLTKESL